MCISLQLKLTYADQLACQTMDAAKYIHTLICFMYISDVPYWFWIMGSTVEWFHWFVLWNLIWTYLESNRPMMWAVSLLDNGPNIRQRSWCGHRLEFEHVHFGINTNRKTQGKHRLNTNIPYMSIKSSEKSFVVYERRVNFKWLS